MRTVHITIEEELVGKVDEAARSLGTSRSAFARAALRAALPTSRARRMERKHREGYMRKPVTSDEFGAWEREQVWDE